MTAITSTKAGSWFTKHVYFPLDRWLFKKTKWTDREFRLFALEPRG